VSTAADRDGGLHPREIGLTAARMLVDRIRGEARPAQRVIQPSRPVMLGATSS
jgi:LacI family transcriptional regulator